MRIWVFQTSLVMFLLLSGCGPEDEDDTNENAADVSAEMSANAGADTSTATLSDQAMDEQTGEAQQDLTKWEICYKVTYTLAKAACTRTHLPPDYCHHLADGTATTACLPLIGLSEGGE